MTTIAELMSQIKQSVTELEQNLAELHLPFAGMIDAEIIEQVEDERNKDHYHDEQI